MRPLSAGCAKLGCSEVLACTRYDPVRTCTLTTACTQSSWGPRGIDGAHGGRRRTASPFHSGGGAVAAGGHSAESRVCIFSGNVIYQGALLRRDVTFWGRRRRGGGHSAESRVCIFSGNVIYRGALLRRDVICLGALYRRNGNYLGALLGSFYRRDVIYLGAFHRRNVIHLGALLGACYRRKRNLSRGLFIVETLLIYPWASQEPIKLILSHSKRL